MIIAGEVLKWGFIQLNKNVSQCMRFRLLECRPPDYESGDGVPALRQPHWLPGKEPTSGQHTEAAALCVSDLQGKGWSCKPNCLQSQYYSIQLDLWHK